MSSNILLPISSVRRDTSRNRRIHSDDDVFGHPGDVHLLAKQDKNTNPQNLVAGSTVQNIDELSSVDDCHRGVLTASSIELVDTNPDNLEVGSVIQYGEPVQCGVIKWIGNLPDETDLFAGVEMVRHSNFIDDILTSVTLFTR